MAISPASLHDLKQESTKVVRVFNSVVTVPDTIHSKFALLYLLFRERMSQERGLPKGTHRKEEEGAADLECEYGKREQSTWHRLRIPKNIGVG